jgi:enoyl-CoA hydratase
MSGTTASGPECGGILVDVDARVARVRLNRPERRNAVSLKDMRELGRVIAVMSGREDVHCIVLSGAGGAFCAGADLPDGGFPDDEESAAMMAAVTPVILGIVQAPVPVIAQVDGAAAGVGASMALACDLVIASTRAFFLLPFTGIGLMPDGGATLTVAATLGRARAMRLALLNERLPAVDARDAGLIAMVCEPDDLPETVAAIAADLAGGATRAIAATKAAINAQTLGGLDLALAEEARLQLPLLRSWEYREGVTAFRERRRPDFRAAPRA